MRKRLLVLFAALMTLAPISASAAAGRVVVVGRPFYGGYYRPFWGPYWGPGWGPWGGWGGYYGGYGGYYGGYYRTRVIVRPPPPPHH